MPECPRFFAARSNLHLPRRIKYTESSYSGNSMGVRRLKTAALVGFVLVGGVAYFSDAGAARAQRSGTQETKAAVLASVAGYRAWRLVSKPAPESPSGIFRITDAAVSG